MLPLNIKQQKFTRVSSRMTPELQKMQAKYKGKTDEASVKKMRAEQQAIYSKYGTNQASGCLPLLITLPIMLALYSVINNVPGYVTEVRKPYTEVANAIIASEDILPVGSIFVETEEDDDNKDKEKDNTDENNVFTDKELTKYRATVKDITDKDQDKVRKTIISSLAKYSTSDWDILVDILEYKKQAVSDMTEEKLTELEISNDKIDKLDKSAITVNENKDSISKVNKFLIFKITDAPGWAFPGVLIPLLSMALSYVQGKQLNVKKKEEEKNDSPTAGAMSSMNVVMPIMSGFFCVMLPIGVGIYWIATSVYTIIQQFFVNKYLDKIGIDELITNNVKKTNKKITNNVSNGASIKELATKQTKAIDTISVKDDTNKKSEPAIDIEEDSTEASDSSNKKSVNTGSISEIANLLKNRNIEKGDK